MRNILSNLRTFRNLNGSLSWFFHLYQPHQRTAKNFITGRRMDIHGLAVQKKINPLGKVTIFLLLLFLRILVDSYFLNFLTDMESFNPANYEILYGCVQHMCDCFADYPPDPENSADRQKIEEFEET